MAGKNTIQEEMSLVKMGKVIRVSTDKLIPTESELREVSQGESLHKLIEAYSNGLHDEIPIIPVKRSINDCEEEEFFVLDGNHRGTVADLFSKEVYVYIPDDEWDGIKRKEFEDYPLHKTNDKLRRVNHLIAMRWDEVEHDSFSSPTSFKDMRNRYDFLKDIKSAQEYFGIAA
jgi:hypothetical protein